MLTTFPGSKWSTEYGLRLGSSDDGGRYLITFGSGAVSRIDLPAGTTAWTNTSGSENLPVEPDGEHAARRPRSMPGRRGVHGVATSVLRRRLRVGVRTGRCDRGEDAATLRPTNRCDRPTRPHHRSEGTPGVELQRRGGGTVEARRERPDPTGDRLRSRLGRNVRVQLDGDAVELRRRGSTIRRSGIRSRER